jgi:hypothetical protein
VCRAKLPMCLLCPLVAECGGPRPSDSARKPRSPGEFQGSARYYRGRVVDVLRRLPHGAGISIDDLASHTAPASARARLVALIGQLASDGMLSVDAAQQVRLPD